MKYRAAVFLDRDGTIIEEAGYLSDPAAIRLLPGAGKAITALNRANIAVVMVTNQSGVARGFFDEAAVAAIHHRLQYLLLQEGAQLNAVYFCPHLPDARLPEYRLECRCRKPAPGMIEQAVEALKLHSLPFYVVGDKKADMDLASAVGARRILVRTGYGARTEAQLRREDDMPDRVVDGLPEAVREILERYGFSRSGTE